MKTSRVLNFLSLQKQTVNTRSQDLWTPWTSLRLTEPRPEGDSLAAGGSREAAQTQQEDSTYQDPVIELYGCGILKDVSQHGGEGKEIIWDPALPHFGERIVHKASIQPCHEGTCNPRAENETARARGGEGGSPGHTALVQELSSILNFF